MTKPSALARQPSRLQLPQGPWATVLQGLCARFPRIPEAVWRSRFERGLVTGKDGTPLMADLPYRAGFEVLYFREVDEEVEIPFAESIVFQDAHLVVADKPHFLPVTPAGKFVRETLLGRLIERLNNPDLVPLHRIDRETAGLVMFSANPPSRSAYQGLFRERSVEKRYEAMAPALPGQVFPLVRKTRIVQGEPFFRMREVDGEPNSETRIEVMSTEGDSWRYALFPVTGRKHQLRVHMAALGAAIVNDRLYPETGQTTAEFEHPLKLLAHSLEFVDPLTKRVRMFATSREIS